MVIKKFTSVVAGPVARLISIGKPLQRLLAFSLADESIAPAKAVTVSIGKDAFSVAYASRIFSRITIKGFKTYPVEDKFPGPESLASSVELALSVLGAPRADITLSIPKTWTIIKIAEFPSAVKDNISDVVSYEMDRLTPLSPGEVLYDFRILKEDQGKIRILLVAAKTDLINPYREALLDKGFPVSRVTLNLSGAGSLCRYVENVDDFLFVKVSEKEYEGALFSDGSPSGTFAGSFRSEDERANLDMLVAEIDSLVRVAREEGKSPRAMVSLKDRTSSFGEMLKLRLTAPFRILEETELPFGAGARGIPPESAGGVIESLWPKAKGLNLLARGQQERVKPPLALTIVLITVLLVVWAVYLAAPIKIEGNRLREIERQIAMRKDEVRKVEALKKDIGALEEEISSINGFKEDRPMALTILRELTTILPKSAWLTRARVTETTVEIEGYAS
ncbi:MAG TPA: hypothetical protein VED67_03095, partial [Thermodesulfovibrionales bacterium]|nr:hypothetical protein [Thermodesulfovibrionales bacterium]